MNARSVKMFCVVVVVMAVVACTVAMPGGGGGGGMLGGMMGGGGKGHKHGGGSSIVEMLAAGMVAKMLSEMHGGCHHGWVGQQRKGILIFIIYFLPLFPWREA